MRWWVLVLCRVSQESENLRLLAGRGQYIRPVSLLSQAQRLYGRLWLIFLISLLVNKRKNEHIRNIANCSASRYCEYAYFAMSSQEAFRYLARSRMEEDRDVAIDTM
jgi:hypothetical protein